MDNITKNLPWDVKSTLYKVKNSLLNYTEMESKVREATNNDAWGASSTLLLEISRGTQNYQLFNEIMPMIYKRFQENKSWRQTYKTLQLVEYLLKNGSERCIDNVRDHLYEIRTLTSFQYVDEKGKDQGINVRHRAKEIIELIEDPDRLRSEREKAQNNRNKYAGVSSDEVKYGGFSSQQQNSSSSFAASSNNYERRESASYNSQPSQPDRSMPTVKMAASATVTPVVAQSSSNTGALLDIGGGFSQPAAPQPKQDEWAEFAAVPAQPQKQLIDEFADFQGASAQQPVQQQGFASFGGFQQPAAQPTIAQFGQMSSTPAMQQFGSPSPMQQFGQPVTSPPKQQLGAASPQPMQQFNGFQQPQQQQFNAFQPQLNQASPAPQQQAWGSPLQPLSPATSTSSQQAPKKNDVWNTGLVNLDGLGKPQNNQNNTGPPMNQMPVQSQFQAQPAQNQFGWGFQQPQQAPMQFQQQKTGLAANDWGAFQSQTQQKQPQNNNDLLF